MKCYYVLESKPTTSINTKNAHFLCPDAALLEVPEDHKCLTLSKEGCFLRFCVQWQELRAMYTLNNKGAQGGTPQNQNYFWRVGPL